MIFFRAIKPVIRYSFFVPGEPRHGDSTHQATSNEQRGTSNESSLRELQYREFTRWLAIPIELDAVRHARA
jgi:hypothetical protein